MHTLPSGEGLPRVMVPGDPERNAYAEQQRHGIRLHDSLVDNLNQVSKECGLDPIHATSQ